jgi:hypothetical protein
VTEQLAFHQARPDGPAVHLDERPVSPRAQLVDRPGDEFLPGAGLAQEEHGGVGDRHLPDLVEQGPQGPAFADDLRESDLATDLLLQVGVLHQQPVAQLPVLLEDLGALDGDRGLLSQDAKVGELFLVDVPPGQRAQHPEQFVALDDEGKGRR